MKFETLTEAQKLVVINYFDGFEVVINEKPTYDQIAKMFDNLGDDDEREEILAL